MKFSKEDTLCIKGIAILFLYVHHQFLDPSRYKGYYVNFFPFTQQHVQYIAQFFKICVGMFVFLSAYGITISLKNKSTNYNLSRKEANCIIANRYINLMSGYLIIFIIAQLYSWNGYRQYIVYGTDKKSIFYFFIDMLGLAHLFNTPTFNATWWYMSFAIIIILIMPILFCAYGRFGILLVFISILLPRALGFKIVDLTRWLSAITLGIYFADRNMLSKLKELSICKHKNISKLIKFCFATFFLVLFIFTRQSSIGSKFIDIWDSLIPVYIVYYSFEFIIDISTIRPILKLLGKHSMNMFLSHTFFRAIYFQSFIYSFKNAWVDTFVLIIVTLVLSIVIEFFKRTFRYNDFIDMLRKNTTNYIMNN